MLNTLYIIGNGFDRHHGLETRYQAFAIYLKNNYSDIYDLFTKYYGLPDLDTNDPNSYNDPLWAEFETALADLDFETVLDDNTNYLANPSSPDFRDRDWHAYQFKMQSIVDKLTKEMAKALKEFILSVTFPDEVDDKLIKLESNALFLNFNYTDTLQKYYGIKISKILYIHRNAKNLLDEIILGHGVDPSTFEEKEELPPEGLNEEEMERWSEQKSDNYDYSFESGKSELMSYFKSSYKPTKEIIEQNKDFFTTLRKINQVIVLGHSISVIDQTYFKKVIETTNKRCILFRIFGCKRTKWIVSYYSESERVSHIEKLIHLGLRKEDVCLVKMDELRRKYINYFN
jgi:hypothetical protein